jgi:ABC-type nitrate/sulfonate/bicarbonate transport system permease component
MKSLIKQRQIAILLKPLLLPFLIFILWYLIPMGGIVSDAVLPSPAKVWLSLKEGLQTGELFKNIIASLVRIGIGYLLAIGIAIPLGLAIGWFKTMEILTDFILSVIRLIPPIAWIPFAMLWFGLGNASTIFVIVIAAFFPTLANTAYGVKATPLNLIQAALTLGAKKDSWFLFKEVVLPGAVPAIITGMRLSLGYAWTSVVAAEMFAARQGLGFFLMESRILMRGSGILLGMIVIAFLGCIMYKFVRYLERRLLYWTS